MAHLAASAEEEEEAFQYPTSLLKSASLVVSPTKLGRKNEGKHTRTRKRAQADDLNGPKQKVARTAPSPSLLADPPIAPQRQTQEPVSSYELPLLFSGYESYMESVLANCAGFYRVSNDFFVVQGWDSRREQATDHWYHLQYVITPDGEQLGCACPQLARSDCVHRQFFREYEVPKLNYADYPDSSDRPQVFLRRCVHGDSFLTLLSVPSTSSAKLTGRAIVAHEGTSFRTGTWSCSKDQSGRCSHIQATITALAEQLGEDMEYFGSYLPSALSDAAEQSTPSAERPVDTSVSHLPVRLPPWAELPSDPKDYERSAPLFQQPSRLILTAESRCSCVEHCSFDSSLPTVYRECKIYTFTTVYHCSIELQPCPNSAPLKRRFIGPDLRELGLFNYNNTSIFTHDLLDDYTSAFCTSETPFVAWITVISRRYERLGCSFVGEDLFRSVWFAYAKLQQYPGDMICSDCGPHPDTVIWDGVTLAFGRKKLLGSLHPPTISGPGAALRSKIKYQPHQHLIQDSGLRNRMKQMLRGPTPQAADESDSDNDSPTTANRNEAAITHIKLVDQVRIELNHVCKPLSDLVQVWFGPLAFRKGTVVPAEYRNILRQIAAEESVLQMVNVPSLRHLREFLLSPAHEAHHLLSMPAFYHAYSSSCPFKGIFGILEWIEVVARETINGLMVEPPLEQVSAVIPEDEWTKTGCLYSFPKIRERPQYPKLKSDAIREKSAKRGGKCSKYYAQYGQQGLTGGIVAVWCTHSICYGFHCVPDCEGRNDIFSALVTRWPTAPKRVVYDFACALGPYCMLREPQFFAETSFLIDHFHSTGHSKCSRACFLSEYANTNPSLARINSSAAESGNGGIKKIRKSVSYMGQERAIIYTKVYLSMWNRTKLLKILKERRPGA